MLLTLSEALAFNEEAKNNGFSQLSIWYQGELQANAPAWAIVNPSANSITLDNLSEVSWKLLSKNDNLDSL